MTPDVLTGSGIAGGAVSLAYAVKLIVEAKRENRGTPVADAAAANSVLLSALQEERGARAALADEVDELRQANGDLYEHVQRQRREHEAEIRDMRQQYEQELQSMREQLLHLTGQLEDLQTRIRAGLPKFEKE